MKQSIHIHIVDGIKNSELGKGGEKPYKNTYIPSSFHRFLDQYMYDDVKAAVSA